jgi:AmmeMemoRadiSam system protein B
MELDFMPSPVEDRPGLLIRDPFGFSGATLIIPPALVRGLSCFDGERDQTNLRDVIHEATGELRSGELGRRLEEALDQAGFLETIRFMELRDQAILSFEQSDVREPSHAGSAYPDEREELEAWMAEGMAGGDPSDGQLVGIAAPHASPDGGWASYRKAYRALGDWAREKTFVILGTSHYGEPDAFGLTRKEFVTPWGTARTDRGLVDELARKAPASIRMEDYCHRIEHSIEFQVVFLQSLFGADVKILPILVGSFGQAILDGRLPEQNEQVAAFFDALGEIRSREAGNLVTVLGVDMAHMGRRYGDDSPAEPFRGVMSEVEQRDRRRISSLAEGDAAGFWDQVKENRDDLKWCGSAPFYTFLRTGDAVRGSLLQYEQWPIDGESVVSFGAMTFSRA